MKLSTFTSLLAVFSGFVASVPVPDAEPAEIEARSFATIHPSLIVNIYSPGGGGSTSNTAAVYRYVGQGGVEYLTNSLIAFTFSQGYPGRTCTFSFQGAQYAYGTRKVQLFTVGGPILPNNTWTSRPYRDIPYGIFTVSPDLQTATWDDIPTPTFSCPSSATTLGYEVLAEGDYDAVGWDINSGSIEVL